ncbi:MAG: phenylacetate--CoA ligase family protein [Acidimicrobiales bacterium]
MRMATPAPASPLVAATMPLRHLRWAVLGAVARVAHRVSRANLRSFRWGARHGGRLAARLSAPAGAATARRAMRTVPAYRALVAAAGAPAPARTAAAWLAGLPVTTKRSYVDRWSLAERCQHGRIPATGCQLDESAGSSGVPYTWVRSRRELADVHRSLALLARHLLPEPDGRPVVVLNAFSMGAWATGTNVSAALTAVGTVKSCGPDVDKVLGTVALLGAGPTYVVCGYPPFLRTLVEAAPARDLDLSAHRLYGFVGGEGMTEAARDRLERTFTQVWSAYGASDLDIGVACETPVSIWLRRQAAARPELALALFGRTDRLPMVFQYDPCDYHVTTVRSPAGAEELVVTVSRPLLSPRVRYDVGDEGGTVPYAAALRACRAAGLDPSEADARPFTLPFLFVHGRADQTLSYLGANLYPEDVGAAVAGHPAADRLGAFCMELAEVGDGDVRPLVHVEADDPGDRALAAGLAAAVRDHLASVSADYRTALAESAAAGDVRVRLWEQGTGPFVPNRSRIKHRHVLTADRPSPGCHREARP